MNGEDELFFDGNCGLCHHAVRFILDHGKKGQRFRFAPIGGDTFHQMLAPEHRAGLPDSLVILTASGEILARSRAALHVFDALGGGWRLLGWMGMLLPRILSDAMYDLVALNRHRLFGRPADVCPVSSGAQRQRFDP